jgi:uncharacterized membrane protein
MNLLSEFGLDLAAFTASIALVVAYYVFLHFKVRNDPTYSIHGVNALARHLWVANIMNNPGKDVMAVQTMRNFIMGTSLMASTAALLIIGTLTLSGQADHIAQGWHTLNITGSHAAELWVFKVLFLLIDFIVAFFAFAMSIRLSNHVVFMINVQEHNINHNLSPQAVARRLHRAGSMFSIGMRAFFFAIPFVFWLFGPYFLLVSAVGLVITLYRVDRSETEEEYAHAADISIPGAAAPQVISMNAKYANN